VLDFGIAKFRPTGEISGVTKGLTQTGALMGSPLYMSPEQAKGLRNIDRRSDLWSLGIVLYAALTGECPHDSIDTLGQLIISICSVPPEPVQEAAPWVSPEIADFVERALRINMDERYATAEVMLADVLRIPGSTEPLTRKDFEAVDESARQVVAPLSRVSQLRQDSSSDQMLSASGNELTVVDSARPQSIPQVNSGTHNGLSSDEAKPQVTGTSKGLVVATGLALLVAAGLAVKLLGTKAAMPSNAANTTSGAQATATPQKASRTAASTAKASARATTEAVPSKVIVQLDVQPLGAQVFLGATLLGPSSEPLELQHSEKALALRLVKAGYQDKTIQLVPNKAQKKKVYLVSAKGRSPKGPAAPPVPKPKAPKRANGDLEQPW
jgi:eukaryotic-like serine/threonine-protein kinase